MDLLPISADSHVTEPPNCYTDHIDPKYRDIAPHIVRHDTYGDMFVVDGMKRPIPVGMIAAAGKEPSEMRLTGTRFEELHRGGWDPGQRLTDQDRDGLAAEVVYPNIGLLLCNLPDFDYKKACFDAYNRWLQGYCEAAPDRLHGIAQIAMRSVEEGIEDLRRAREMGFRGVMMPGDPKISDYHDPVYDPFYEAAVDLNLPLSFHAYTPGDGSGRIRGPRINGYLAVIRGCQDIIGAFILGGVFERHPRLKLVCVEADIGWAPHFMYRMDHVYERHRHWTKSKELERLPSEYFRRNVWMTFQDDWTAFQFRGACNIERLMWANDFPHPDSTWPRSREVLAEHTKDMSDHDRRRIVRDNVVELYGLETA